MVRELHRLGYERLRVAPGLAARGGAWRCDVVPAAETCRENGTLTPPGRSAQRTTARGWAARLRVGRAERDSPAQLAAKFVARFPAVAAAGFGDDAAYAAWFAEMVRVTAPMGLPYAYWDSDGRWTLGITQLNTTAGGPVPVPPPGVAHWESA